MPPASVSLVRLLVVDDSELVRAGLRAALAEETGIQVVAEAGTGASAVAAAAAHHPDVVLLDVRLPDFSGFEAARLISGQSPSTRIIFLSSVVDDAMLLRAIESGGSGFLLKELSLDRLVQSIRSVAEGSSIIDPQLTARVLALMRSPTSQPPASRLESLSVQEQRVLALVAEGKTNKEVGVALDLSEKTVRNYLANVFSKLNLTRRSQAAALYARASTSKTA